MKNEQNCSVYWSLLSCDDWNLYMAATPEGLCYIGSQNHPIEELESWIIHKLPCDKLLQDDEKLKPYKEQLASYLQGSRSSFSVPFDLRGTTFQLSVWKALVDIPYGVTASYSDIADMLDKPNAVRAVGTAIGANPLLITIPCHRVIGKNGSLTGYRGGLDMKTKLLELEQSALACADKGGARNG